MSENLYEAHRQWAQRPADERFASLKELLDFTQRQKSISSQVLRRMGDLKLGVTKDEGITLNGDLSQAYLSNWGFGQLSRAIGAPASYLRSLSPYLARNCLQYGLEQSKDDAMVLVRDKSSNGSFERYASAFTSPSYGRIWDADIVGNLMKAVESTPWHVPPTSPNQKSKSSGLYASDHDMFAFLVNDDNPVEVGNSRLGKGFFCWNSETGAATFGLTTFLYNYVCGNHIVWGAEDIQELKIFHRTHAPKRLQDEAIPLLNKFVENRALDDSIKQTVDKAQNVYIGNNIEKALIWFNNGAFTKTEVMKGWETGITEGQEVSNLWGMVQGLTAYAREMDFIDKRVNLERRAGALLAKL